jgi:small-conductance mechanosensitive channel
MKTSNNKLWVKKLNLSNIQLLLLLSTAINLLPSSITAQIKADSLFEQEVAPVTIDGEPLFYVRGISSFTGTRRAQEIAERIESVADDPTIQPNSSQIIHSEISDDIVFGKKFIMSVFDADSKLEGVRREVLATAIQKNITKAIYKYRYERSSEALLKKTFYAIGATIITFLILFLIHWILRKIHTKLEERLKSKIEKLESRSFQMIRSKQLWTTFYNFVKTIKVILTVIIVFIYIQYVLGLYPWTKYVSKSLLGFFLKPLGDFGLSILNFLPNLAFLIVIFLITRYLLKLIKLLFYGLEQGTIKISGFDAEWSVPTYKILRILLVAFAVIVAYPYIPGSDSDAFKGVSLFIGVLFSLGSSSLIGNLIAGYTMTYRKTFHKGEMVKIDDHLGQVMDIKLFVTRIKTPKNEEIIVPNSVVLGSNVVNYSTHAKEKGLILHTTVGIGYETSWRQVEDMLKEAAARTEGILKEPSPFVLQKSLGDFAITYELNAYCNNPLDMMKYYTALHQNILDVFNENNVQIMTPAYEGDPHEPKVVPKDKWFTPLAIKSKSEGEKK